MMPKAKVAFVHTDLRAYWPSRLLALGRSLRERGSELTVIEIAGNGSPYEFAEEKRPDGEVSWSVLFPKRDLRQMSGRMMAGAVERKLDEWQPNVVVAGGIAFPSGAAAVRWARKNHRAVVIFDNVRQEDVPRSPAVELVKRRIYAHVDAMLVPAESHVRSYVHWGIPRSRICFGLNVVDNEWFSNLADTFRMRAPVFRREGGLPEKFFLGVGRQVPKKNWIRCLQAYHRYRARSGSSPWGLVLVGDGPDHARLKNLIEQERIPDVVLPGMVQGDNLVRYYVSASALVLPSLFGETWGLVVNEAMACGLPVLVSKQCGCAETLVRDNMNGWAFSPERTTELAERMLQMSGLSDQKYQSMVSASREIIRPWGLGRFVEGAEAAITACRQVQRGFTSPFDRLVISLWNGRFRPT